MVARTRRFRRLRLLALSPLVSRMQLAPHDEGLVGNCATISGTGGGGLFRPLPWCFWVFRLSFLAWTQYSSLN